MYDFVSGTLVKKEPMSAVVEVQGVGYALSISLNTYNHLPQTGTTTRLFTYLYVRDDALLLYGFADEEERSMFRMLQGVSGIGAKLALNILSGSGVAELRRNVAAGNVAALTAVPGIGRKTAERIIVELRDSIGRMSDGERLSVASGTPDKRTEAIRALITLGYTQQAAEKAVATVLASDEGISLSDCIKLTLQLLRKG